MRAAYENTEQVRAAIAADLSAKPAYKGLSDIAFARPVGARTWFQASNPSERWKWEFMFQDLPPVKTNPPIERAELQSASRK